MLAPVIVLIALGLPKTRILLLTNNDILQLIATTFELNSIALIDIFALADFTITDEQATTWLKAESDEAAETLSDTNLSVFLNGFINLKRGKRDGEQPQPQTHLNNNMIFQKLRIALDLKTEDIVDIFQLANFDLSKHEVTAFFRKPGNKHYKECRDKTLKKFLQGVHTQLNESETDLDLELDSDL